MEHRVGRGHEGSGGQGIEGFIGEEENLVDGAGLDLMPVKMDLEKGYVLSRGDSGEKFVLFSFLSCIKHE